MSNLLRDFEVEAKNTSLEARQRWRSSVSIVKNRARRFRNIPDLDKQAENETKRHQIQVLSLSLFLIPFSYNLFRLMILFS